VLLKERKISEKRLLTIILWFSLCSENEMYLSIETVDSSERVKVTVLEDVL
jgi:hypothetical protein